MFIVEVIPISRGIAKEKLSYFSREKVPEGSVVTVPVRKNSFVSGLVVGNKEAVREKAEIRRGNFALKKIGRVRGEGFLTEPFAAAARSAARFFACSAGSVLNELVPRHILENPDKVTAKNRAREKSQREFISEHLIVQDEEEERFAAYRSLVREEFAKNNSVYFCSPTTYDAKKAYSTLEKGIEQYAFLLHSSLPKKELLSVWNGASGEEHPVLVVATAGFFSIPRNDWGLVILDKESSKHYKSQTRPYLDVRVFAEIFADKLSARVVFGDMALRAETVWRYRRGELAGVSPPKFKYLGTAVEEFVDMRKRSEKNGKNFELMPPSLANLVAKNKDRNERLFIFCARRGLAPITVCSDCGNIVKCRNCKAPLVLHKSGGGNVYVCHRCNDVETSERRCLACQSWKLTPLGVGIELLEEAISKKFPDIKVWRIDSDRTKTEKNVLDTVEKWRKKPGEVLLGTEMALPYLPKTENVAVSSIDSLFSVPDFRINEKIFGVVLLLRSLALGTFLLQTRNPEQKAISLGMSGNLLDFYREEIKEREDFDFPPFNLFIKINVSGERGAVSKDMEWLKQTLEGYTLDIFSGVAVGKNKKYSLNALLRTKKESWLRDEGLFSKLLSLPPKFSVQVDPESLL